MLFVWVVVGVQQKLMGGVSLSQVVGYVFQSARSVWNLKKMNFIKSND